MGVTFTDMDALDAHDTVPDGDAPEFTIGQVAVGRLLATGALTREMLAKTLLIARTGSKAYGLAVETSDDDFVGIFHETREQVFGSSVTDSVQRRTAASGERSVAGDTELSMHALRKISGIMAKGNPNSLEVLFFDDHPFMTPAGRRLIERRDIFVGAGAGRHHLGFLRSQRAQLVGTRKPSVKRSDLMSEHGYDVKFAMHSLRVGHQGLQIMTERRLSFPFTGDLRDTLLAVRRGELALEEVIRMIDDVAARLEAMVDADTMPETDRDAVARLVADIHMELWESEKC